MGILIDGKNFKELYCKDDDCMRVLGLVRKKEPKPGMILRITCPNCGKINEWRFGYSQLEEQFDTVKESYTTKGGEK